jgi:hypothetical protein
MNIRQAKKDLHTKGFLDLPTDKVNYIKEINRLRKEKNAVS